MMLQNTIEDIIKNFQKEINEINIKLKEDLKKGNLLGFEKELSMRTSNLYNELALNLIEEMGNTKELEVIAKRLGQKKGLRKIRKTEVNLQLKTGKTIKVPSYYALRAESKKKKKQKRGPNGKGEHLLLEYWGCIDKASPSYYSYTTMLSILCPSFDIVLKVLESQKIDAEYKRIRRLAYKVSKKCFKERTTIGMKPNENVVDKRVIISIDGGKTRTRITNNDKKYCKISKNKRNKFDTPWREPKMFVIHVLQDDGSLSKTHLPIYDGMIDKPDAVFDLLHLYLEKLQINKASEIVFVADGAAWIWTRIDSLFEELGVDKDKIYQTVDYYHAVQHIYSILRIFTHKQINDENKKLIIREFKDYLYNGNVSLLIEKATELANGRKRILNEIGYFQRHQHRMNYPLLRSAKLPIGSGIIESAIRRIINLRFKSPSSFWLVNNVENLIFLRGIFLSGRWNIMIQNLTQQNHRLDFLLHAS